MKAILISDHAKWCALMMNGNKTVEVRKENVGKAVQKLIDEYGYADIYVYCSKGKPLLLYRDVEKEARLYGCDLSKKCYIASVGRKKTRLPNKYDLSGKVLFKFRCYKVSDFSKGELIYYKNDGWCGTEVEHINTNGMCLTEEELNNYLKGKKGYAIHISDLEIFDKPKELSEFSGIRPNGLTYMLEKAPQSWQFVESEQ